MKVTISIVTEAADLLFDFVVALEKEWHSPILFTEPDALHLAAILEDEAPYLTGLLRSAVKTAGAARIVLAVLADQEAGLVRTPTRPVAKGGVALSQAIKQALEMGLVRPGDARQWIQQTYPHLSERTQTPAFHAVFAQQRKNMREQMAAN